MSALHEELTGRAPACRLCQFLLTLSHAEAAEWRAELALPVTEVGNMAVQRAMQKRGIAIAESSVRRHRENHERVR